MPEYDEEPKVGYVLDDTTADMMAVGAGMKRLEQGYKDPGQEATTIAIIIAPVMAFIGLAIGLISPASRYTGGLYTLGIIFFVTCIISPFITLVPIQMWRRQVRKLETDPKLTPLQVKNRKQLYLVIIMLFLGATTFLFWAGAYSSY